MHHAVPGGLLRRVLQKASRVPDGLATAEQLFFRPKEQPGLGSYSKTRATHESPHMKVYKRVQDLSKYFR